MSRSKKYFLFIVGLLVVLTVGSRLKAQDQQPQQGQQPSQQEMIQQIMRIANPHPAGKEAKRYEIDAKRMGVNPTSEDALPRSREFIRIDSTYYVGWMFEGAYKYEHAADYLGFKNAAVPLERAMNVLERDYRKQLATRTDNVITYIPMMGFQQDYTMIAYYLLQCYLNTEQPDKAYALVRRVLKWNLQRDYYMDSYDYLAWITHRNRFYTHDKYYFLKNSIAANEALANKYLDSALVRIDRNVALNSHILQPGYAVMERMSVYHYKNILYSYALNIDSAMHYFNLMRGSGIFPHNNYANFRGICGDFRTAEDEYKQAAGQDGGDKRLQEWVYYSSIIDIYKSQTKTGIELTKDMIKAAGSTPGFGWYNIALSRCMLYDGQVSESERYADKAASFKELHIGTTLGESQYDFSIQLLKLIDKEQEYEMQRFENRNWWYNPAVLSNMAMLTGQKFLQQFLIINQFAQNPERDMVIYKLFSTESTVSWDEIWYLIRDYSTQFFLDRFRNAAATDNRKYIHKYFELFVAQLEMKQGHYKDAEELLAQIARDPNIDPEYEKLFIARLYQDQAECAKELNKTDVFNERMFALYKLFPQLVPYTGMQTNMRLHVSGDADSKVVNRLKDCNVNWVTNTSTPAPDAYVIFAGNGKKNITYYVIDNSGNYIVQKQSFAYQKPEDAGKELAYRLFNIGGKEPEHKDDAATAL